MPIYTYRAKNLQGEEINGEYESATVENLKSMLEEKGFFLINVDKKANEFEFKLLERINTKDLSVFCRQFSVILHSGIPIVEAISILRDQAEKKKMHETLDVVHENLQKGQLLSESLDEFPNIFPEFLRSMVKVGEASGALDEIMERLADYFDRESTIRKKVRTASTYPMILMVMTVGIVIVLMIFVLPMFQDILGSMGAELPAITKILLGISALIKNYVVLLLILVVIAVALISYYFKSESGLYLIDRMKLRIPIIKVTVKKIMTSRFARSMGILLRSGIPIVEAIDIMSILLGNRVIEERFRMCQEDVRQGKGLSGPLRDVSIFPPMLIHMVAVGEQTGELDEMLMRTSSFYDDEVEEAVDKMTAMIEPIMIVVLATVVGSILLAVMLPMMNLMEAIG